MPWLSSLSENIVSYSVGRFYTECVNSTIYPEFSGMEIMGEKGLNSKEIIGFSKILRNAPKLRSVKLKVKFCVLCKFYADISAEAFSLLTAVHPVMHEADTHRHTRRTRAPVAFGGNLFV